jgi:hypothetical protein
MFAMVSPTHGSVNNAKDTDSGRILANYGTMLFHNKEFSMFGQGGAQKNA